MKQFFGVVAVILVVNSSSPGQIVRSHGVKIGVCSATQSWEVNSKTTQGTHYRWGVDVGAFVEWFQLPVFSFSSEIHYIQKGLKYDIPVTSESDPNGTGEFIVVTPTLNYLSLPLLGKFRLDLPQAEVFLLLGPRFDFVLNRDGDEVFDSQINQFDSFEFGGEIGIGLHTRAFLGLTTGLEVKFSPSFQEGYSDDFIAMRNRSFELLLTLGK